jgi:hypothetical protein
MHFVLKKPLASYRQFNSLEVRISAQILSFILSNKTGLSDRSKEEMLATIEAATVRQGEFFMFQCGSKMTVHTDLGNAESKQKPKTRFFIYGYHYGGDDIRAAAEALRYGHAIYKSWQHRDNYKLVTGRDLRLERPWS